MAGLARGALAVCAEPSLTVYESATPPVADQDCHLKMSPILCLRFRAVSALESRRLSAKFSCSSRCFTRAVPAAFVVH